MEIPLSKREKECISLLSQGFRYRDIAIKLGTSARTVEKQIAEARSKLNAKTICHAVAIFVRSEP